jgi:hypothetical protein
MRGIVEEEGRVSGRVEESVAVGVNGRKGDYIGRG